MSILTDIRAEIQRAEEKHGPLPIHVSPSAALVLACSSLEQIAREDLDGQTTAGSLAILAEEVGEAARAETTADLRAELVQVVAVGIRWIGQIDGLSAADCIPATAHPSIMAALGLPADDPPANALEQIRRLREEHADLLAISDAYQHMHTRAVRSEARLSALLAPVEDVDLEEVLRLAAAPARSCTAAEDRDATLVYAAPILAREIAHLRARLAQLEQERDELRLTLAAEQGNPEGAPPGWEKTGWLWWRKEGEVQRETDRAAVHPEGRPHHWRVYAPSLIAEGYETTARAAMLAAAQAHEK